MRSPDHRSNRPAALMFVASTLVLFAAAAVPAQPTYTVLLDLDVNPATGCSLTIDGETFDGAEQILVTTQGVGAVTQVVRQVCTDPATDTFGAPIPIAVPTAPPWPIGLGLGTDGSNVIETYVPLSDLGSPEAVRLGFGTSGPGGEDALLATRALRVGGSAIPALSTWGVLALVATLACAAILVLRHRGPSVACATAFLGAVLVAGVAVAAILLDGQPDDWIAFDLIGTDTVDGPGADLRAAFARIEEGTVFFRIDAFDQGCSAGEVPFDGTFVVVEDAWADYGPGDTVPVEHLPGTETFRILSTNNPYISNTATSYLEFTLDPASALVTGASNECFDYGPGFCLDVTGAGTAACDGTIDVVLEFTGYGSYRLVLVPQ